MADHEISRRQPKEKTEEKHRHRQKELQPLSENPQMSADETPFRPQLKEHIHLLSSSRSGEHLDRLLLQLQQTYGNRYVSNLLKMSAVQAKPTANGPHDVSEQEADKVASDVVGEINQKTQRQAGEEAVMKKPSAGISETVQREELKENNQEEKIEEPYQEKPLEGRVKIIYDQALAKFKKMGKSRIRGGLSKSSRKDEAAHYLKDEVEASKKYPAYYSQQIINSIMGAYKDVFGENLEPEKTPKNRDAQKDTQKGKAPVAEPDKSPGPDNYLNLVRNAKFIKASGGGMGGVFFLYTQKPVDGKKVNPEVVVKFEPGEAVRGKFAENLLAAGGFEVTRSLVYSVNSSQGKMVKNRIQELANSPQTSPLEEGARVRLGQVFGKLNQGKAVIVSDFIPSLGTVAELMAPEQGKEAAKTTPETEQALVEAFNNVENAVGLGKLLVFDAMLGNQDRLEAMNLANVMLAKRGGKWTFVLIDNDAEVPTMLSALGIKLRMEAENNSARYKPNQSFSANKTLSVKEWVKNLIEGGAGENKQTAEIKFIGNAGKSAAEVVENLKSKYLSAKGMEKVKKAINLGLLQRGIMYGISEGANAILNIDSKTLKKMAEQETKSLGKTGLLSTYGLELKQHYMRLVFEQKKKHAEAMTEIEAVASKKMKELTGNADYMIIDQNGVDVVKQQGKIKTK